MTDKAFDKYKNIIDLGDINIDIKRNSWQKSEHSSNFCENLIKLDNCITKTTASSVDIILTNQRSYLMHSVSIETGISDVNTLSRI